MSSSPPSVAPSPDVSFPEAPVLPPGPTVLRTDWSSPAVSVASGEASPLVKAIAKRKESSTADPRNNRRGRPIVPAPLPDSVSFSADGVGRFLFGFTYVAHEPPP